MREAETGRMEVPGQSMGREVFETPSQQKELGVVALAYHPSRSRRHKYHSSDWPGQKARPHLKNNQSRKKEG
jgi:hypothetical protein